MLVNKISYLGIVRSVARNRNLFQIFILVSNIFSWYFPLYIFLRNRLKILTFTYEELLMIFGFHYVSILLSAVIGIALLRKFLSRSRLLSLWMLSGGIFSLSMVLLEIKSLPIISLVFILIGIALGFGYPGCLAYFADFIAVENKATVGGLIFFSAFFGTFLIGFLNSVLSFMENVLVYTLWRMMGFIVFKLLEDKEKRKERKSVKASYKSIVSENSFIFYVIPWTMFCLVNFFVGPLQEQYWSSYVFNLVVIIEFAVGSVAALIGGYFADIVGRKRVVILGYILLGFGYALLSIFPDNAISIGIYAVFDGVAWGLFCLIFLLVIWGDLAGNREKEKYYFLGALPFLISSYMWVIVVPFTQIISISASFSLASFFLFLAVVPLMFAPETLPEKTLRERELRGYIEKAKRVREKFTRS